MAERIPILLFSPRAARGLRLLIPLARYVMSLRPNLSDDIRAAQLPDAEESENYIIAFLISSLMWAFLMAGIVFFVLYFVQAQEPEIIARFTALTGISFFVVFLIAHLSYPSILARKVAEAADRQLIYVLRDMWIQSSSGILLYNILQNIAAANYGTISDDLRKAVRMISSGEREMSVLEKVTSTTRSENFKKALWHVTAAMRTGVGLTTAIKTILDAQTAEQHRAIREYSTSLNFVLLIYLLFAAVAPAILTTFFALLSIFGIFAISCEFLIAIVIMSAIIQIVIIGFMRTARPGVY